MVLAAPAGVLVVVLLVPLPVSSAFAHWCGEEIGSPDDLQLEVGETERYIIYAGGIKTDYLVEANMTVTDNVIPAMRAS